MSQDTIRVALVGCGGMAKRYRAVYAKLPGVTWAVAVDAQPSVLDDCRQGGAERCSTRFEDALASDVDAVVISTPNHLHAEQAVAALAADKHILLQKPIANTLDAADKIVSAAREAHERSGAWAAMYMSNYDDPCSWAIHAMLKQGLLGTIQSIRARDAHRGGLTMNPQNWRSSRDQTGGGSFIQLSIHSINLFCWWLGGRVDHVSAFTENRLCPGIGGDDATAAAVRFSDGTLGTFDSGYASDLCFREIYGTRGWVRFMSDGLRRRLEFRLDERFSFASLISYENPGTIFSQDIPSPTYDDVGNVYNQNVVFIDRIRHDQPPLMTVQAGRDDLAVVEAAYVSARSGRAVHLQYASAIAATNAAD